MMQTWFEKTEDFVQLAWQWCRRHPYGTALIGALLFTLVAHFAIDKPLALHFKHDLHPHWLGFFKVVTDLGLGTVWYLLPLGAMGYCWLNHSMAHMQNVSLHWHNLFLRWRFFLVSMIVTALANTLAKFVIGRLRPRYLFDDGEYGFVMFNTSFGMNSYPSGHTSTIFTAMVCLTLMFPRHKFFFLGLACVVGFSRVTTTVHYLSDVVMGATLATVIVLALRDRFENKFGSVRIGS